MKITSENCIRDYNNHVIYDYNNGEYQSFMDFVRNFGYKIKKLDLNFYNNINDHRFYYAIVHNCRNLIKMTIKNYSISTSEIKCIYCQEEFLKNIIRCQTQLQELNLEGADYSGFTNEVIESINQHSNNLKNVNLYNCCGDFDINLINNDSINVKHLVNNE